MIPLKCPYCQIGLKVDETKLPAGITAFKCPKCKKEIPVSLLGVFETEGETVLVRPIKSNTGKLVIQQNLDTPFQTLFLQEGINIIGRKSNDSSTTQPISTCDKLMSRQHMRVEVKKDEKGGYKHYLSDNNSKNRTLYNNNYLENNEIVVLKENDEIIIGKTLLIFHE